MTNGWSEGYAEEKGGKLERKAWTGYFPAAPLHFVVGATLTFVSLRSLIHNYKGPPLGGPFLLS